MAILERQDTGQRAWLFSRHLVGRSRLAHLRLPEPQVSAEHAILCWTGREWEVHDLGSTNGTLVNGRRLAPGERVPITEGAELVFGTGGSLWRFVDDRPPRAMALPIDGGEPQLAEGDLLALPHEARPEVTVYLDGEGEWWIEQSGAVERAVDGGELMVRERRYRLHLPGVETLTWDPRRLPPSLADIGLRFAVSRDQEYVRLTVLRPDREVELEERAHHALLLTLGRQRLTDEEEARTAAGGEGLSEASLGWVYQDELLRMMGVDENYLHVAIFRCRQDLARIGVAGPATLIERRRSTRQVRIGVRRIEIRML
ncbi:MAG TPA: FHA domain-containing protein [Polyangia bacterium]|jgi:hypothetical protein|nr:FHA domain-containing protein [Polyangia bacterium]